MEAHAVRRAGSGTAAADRRLWEAFQRSGGQRERDALVFRYHRLIGATRRRLGRLLPWWLDPEDVDGAGLVGLLRAVDQFDPGRGYKFETYAIPSIRWAMLRLAETERNARARATYLEDLSEDLVDGGVAPEGAAVSVVSGRELREHVAALPDAEREVIAGYYFEGLTMTQLAARQDVSRQTISRRHLVALDRLANVLDAPG